jgi:hypothetical protein
MAASHQIRVDVHRAQAVDDHGDARLLAVVQDGVQLG